METILTALRGQSPLLWLGLAALIVVALWPKLGKWVKPFLTRVPDELPKATPDEVYRAFKIVHRHAESHGDKAALEHLEDNAVLKCVLCDERADAK